MINIFMGRKKIIETEEERIVRLRSYDKKYMENPEKKIKKVFKK